jgi:hypothetical protein
MLTNFELLEKETCGMTEKTDEWDYNCGGLALGTFDWLRLSSFRSALYDVEDMVGESSFNVSDEEFEELVKLEMEEIVNECVEELLERFSTIRLISSVSELQKDEYAFAFRIAADDFHFIRRLDNGAWVHKPGSSYIREVNDGYVFSKFWPHHDTPYNSTIFLFAKTKN